MRYELFDPANGRTIFLAPLWLCIAICAFCDLDYDDEECWTSGGHEPIAVRRKG